MKILRCLALLSLGVVPSWLMGQTNITNTTYSAGTTPVADRKITAGGTPGVVVQSGATVTYRASVRVTLTAGFKVNAGGRFTANAYLVDMDGDGMDDGWEAARVVTDPAAHDDSDGITNLNEYLLGTDPKVANTADTLNTTQLKINRPN
jgi:hypothetical protein